MNIKIFNNDLPPDINLSDQRELAIDCEAMGLVLGRDPLTLIQIGLKNQQFYLIKLNRENYKAPNLQKLLSDEKIIFIMHYARQDALWIKYHLGTHLKNMFCTKLASKIGRAIGEIQI